MRPSSRAWAAFLLLYGALLAWQVDRWFFTPHGLVSTWAERHDGLSASAGSPGGLTQAFVMGADGLDGLWLRPVVTGQPSGDLLVDVSEVRGDAKVRLERVVVPASVAAAAGSLRVPLRPQRHSRGKALELHLRHVNFGDGPALAFAVTRDDGLPRARFFADGEEQWGDLVFETSARRATLPYWMHEILGPWPAWMRAWPTVVTVLVLFNVALAWACAVAVGLVPTAASRPVEPVAGRRHLDAAGALRRTSRTAVGLVVIAGCSLVLLPTSRDRQLDLIDALPDAAIGTTWPSLHAAISREPVVFFGRISRGIIALPTTRIAWTVDVPPGAVLRVGAAMRPDMWERLGDGIQMFVLVEHAGSPTVGASLTLFPAGVVQHRRLFPVEIDLGRWANQRIRLVFESTPERWGNAVNDVPVWVEPRIEWPRTPASAEARVLR